MRFRIWISACAAVGALAGWVGGASAQNEGAAPRSRLVEALDADGDGELSGAEIANASGALKLLDANGDGALSADEFRPEGGPQRGPGERNGLGQGRGPGGGQGGAPGAELLDRLFAQDANQDGKLSVSEVNERLKPIVERADADGDGQVSREELQKAVAARGGGAGQRPGAPGAGRGGQGRGPAAGQGGGPAGNPQQMAERLFALDANGDGALTREELSKIGENLGQGRGPGGDPQQMVDRLFMLDADGDGSLTREELSKAGERFGQRGAGRGGNPPAEGRPQRPAGGGDR